MSFHPSGIRRALLMGRKRAGANGVACMRFSRFRRQIDVTPHTFFRVDQTADAQTRKKRNAISNYLISNR